ncbi:probable galactinol--sucrose galactosyltransferase 2 [Salvia hispanica]|uniref:probable galactinol--sucrose galactosyltransferase 2 n=1 Tax=Salvia hispanica TaxID=49212 RepID=UPI0020096613|nr:probable galactinol--sucrose galactosyltransferase 2 [Salvia hispanica]
MSISTAFSATAAIYSTRNSRIFFKRLQTNRSQYYPRINHNSAHYITPNSRKVSIFSSFHTRISDRSSSRCKTFAGVALKAEAAMTVAAAPICVEDGSLLVNGKVVLEGVPQNVAVYPVIDGLSSSSAAFIGASSSEPSSRHVFSLGVLRECRFMCLFRHKIWWMIPRFGSSASDIRMETQMLLLEVREESAVQDDDSTLVQSTDNNTSYVLFLPVLEGQFRATLQGNSANELEFCVESGDAHVQTTHVSEAIFVKSGSNPFELIRDSLRILESHKGTFTRIEHKKKPTHLDWFGWCTWDAFYRDVTPRGIREGLESLLEGGCPPKFIIIDDGWQDTFDEFQKEGEPCAEGTQFAIRLAGLKESSKFMESGADMSCHDLHDFVKFIKENHGLKYVYVWHALVGYWGGLLPSSEKMKKYNPKLVYPIQSPGDVGNTRDIAMDYLEKYGVGLIDPEKVYDFYNDLHSYLSSSGVDGVKVDIQNLIETMGAGHGGRVALTRKYQMALEESVARNFQENNLICCMSLNSDSIYSSKRSATVRASEDFMPREPTFQTLHIASVAFNSLLLGEIMVPDWDMFQSHHYTAEFHGAARAVGGCPVYVSDKPGNHDFKLLKKLVLPDGSILRGRYAGRPTRDCLFVDTVMDGKSLLKIWNLNKLTGVVGVFNCQGAGCWSLRDAEQQDPKPISLSGSVSPRDLEFLEEITDERWNGDCAIYSFHTGSLSRLPREGSQQVTLSTLECEVFTISPIHAVNDTLDFSPIGLVDMFNSGGATEGLSFSNDEPSIRIEARGCGRFGAYCSKKPTRCTVDRDEVEFEYDPDNGLLIVKLEGECRIKNINIYY